MGVRIMGVLTLGVILGVITSLITDQPGAGIGVFAATSVLGTIGVVLLRKRKDRMPLMQDVVPVPLSRVGDDRPHRQRR